MADKIPRSGADCYNYLSLSIATKSHMRQIRPRRSSVQGDEAERADPPKVKQEEMSDAGEQVVLKRRSEERGPTERKRKAAVAASQKDAVVARAASLATEGKPTENHSESSSSSESDASSDTSFQKRDKPYERKRSLLPRACLVG